jgi:CRISPR-associated protein (TIGR02584 family)
MADVYLLSPVGASPAVVTETLWYLVVKEGHRVAGVELWVTDSAVGAPRTTLGLLRARVEQGLWRRLRGALGEHAHHLPELPDLFPVRGADPTHPRADPLLVQRYERDGEPMSDIRDLADAEQVASQWHARVRYLCSVLGDIVLVGSISGGRKNVASAVQAAFELQARPQDRLVHVLIHEALDADYASMKDYVAPEQTVRGVPPEQQITLYDVPFPPLRYLPADGSWRAALERDDVGAVWTSLRANLRSAGRHTARLEPDGKAWRLVVFLDGREVYSLRLTGGQAEIYAALIDVPRGTDDPVTEWAEHIDAHPRGRRRDGTMTTLEAVKKRLSDLAAATSELSARGLGEFALSLDGKDSFVPAADRVTV